MIFASLLISYTELSLVRKKITEPQDGNTVLNTMPAVAACITKPADIQGHLRIRSCRKTQRDGNYCSCHHSTFLIFYTTEKKALKQLYHPIIQRSVPEHTVQPARSENNPPTRPRLDLLELSVLLLWRKIKENISQNSPLVCKWDQDGLGALDSIWGRMNHKISMGSWKPAETQMCGEPGQLWMWFPLLSC